jgi:acetyl esterase
MPVDPQLEPFLAQTAAMPPLDQIPLDVLRNTPLVARETEIAIDHIENLTIATPAGDIPARLYRDGAETLPLLVYLHGGGWVVGGLDSHDSICRELAIAGGCAILSVDYRLAPEHKFPAAIDDALAAVRWAAAHAGRLGVDAARIAVGGDSAGGNMAAVTSVRVRDEGGPALAGQLLVYPVTRYHTPPTRSIVENGEGYFLTRGAMVWFSANYLPDESVAHHPHFEVAATADLRNLPPALVITAEFDPLRDEGEQYAEMLAAAGVSVEQKRYDGMIHGFFGMPGVDRSAAAMTLAGDWLKRIFAVS